jgi:hypothetical protein
MYVVVAGSPVPTQSIEAAPPARPSPLPVTTAHCAAASCCTLLLRLPLESTQLGFAARRVFMRVAPCAAIAWCCGLSCKGDQRRGSRR